MTEIWIDNRENKRKFTHAYFDLFVNKTGNYVVDNGMSLVALDRRADKVCGAYLVIDANA